MADKRFFKSREITIAELARLCNCILKDTGKNSYIINGCASLKSASGNDVSYLQVGEFVQREMSKIKDELSNTKAPAIFIKEEDADFLPKGIIALITPTPKQAFIQALDFFYKEEPEYGISSSAKISPSVKFKDKSKVFIGENVIIEDNVEIGTNFICQAGTIIKKGCVIGDNVSIEPLVVISHAIIGNNCVLHRQCQIGAAGFGYEATPKGFKYIQQIGRVVLGNDVEVGSHSCIDRGFLDDTTIGDGTKIDDLVMIGHGCTVGKNCFLCGQVGLAGSTVLEDFVICAGQVGIAGHLTVGSNSQLGAQAGIMKDLPPNSKVMGTPAQNIKDYLKITALTRQFIKQGKKGNDD
jgi:UDP-3-O-[3-hydroxymyristoyl] glucosamine N-acyltransferase